MTGPAVVPRSQQIAVGFMVVSAIATAILGGAVAYELGARHSNQTVVAGAPGSHRGVTSGQATSATTVPLSGQSSSTGAASGGPATATQSGAAAPPAGNVSQAATTGGVIKVGGIFDETGPVDATVERDTVRSYFNSVNEQGGVNGKMLQLIDCDSKFNTTDGANCANKLINDDQVFSVVGWLAPNAEEATAQTFNNAGVPVIGGVGTPEEYRYPLVFPVAPQITTTAVAAANRAADLGFQDVGIVVVNLAFTAPAQKALVDALQARGVAVKDQEPEDATHANYSDVVLAFQAKGVKSVVAVLDPFSYQRLFQSMQGAGFNVPLLGLGLDKGSANPHPDNPDAGYGRFVNGMHSVTGMLEADDHQTDPGVRQYIDTVKKYFPNQVSALDVYTEFSWTSAQMFVDALKRAGPDPSRQALVDALNSTQGFQGGLSSVPITYTAGPHDPNRCFWSLQNKNYVWTTVTDTKCY